MTMRAKTLQLQDFSYEIPHELIAQEALPNREESRLLIYEANRDLTHSKISDLGEYLPSKTLLVFNNSKVFASRILGQLPQGTDIELFLLTKPEKSKECIIPCLLKPSKKIKTGMTLTLRNGCKATVLEREEQGQRAYLVKFHLDSGNFSDWLCDNAFVPLPPYIKRDKPNPWSQSEDSIRYQTVYAKEEGSVAAPTAGLHFTDKLLEKLRDKGIKSEFITLHVGAGTFLPVRTEEISKHNMHSESYKITKQAWERILEAKKNGYKILSVGTTSFRCLESFQKTLHTEEDFDKWNQTKLFIYPESSDYRYISNLFDGMITNFHQPSSTLFMLICSLVGFENAHEIYREAIQEKYRFFSYGDSSLLWF